MKIFKQKTAKNLLLATAVIALSACEETSSFTIEGEIKGGDGKMLYLSNIGITETTFVDSVKIGKDGKFRFKQPQPECYDFYALQTDKKGRRITIAIDSTETVRVVTSSDNFADSCAIEGSPASVKIKELAQLERSLQKQITALINNGSPAIGETRKTIYNLIGEFKRNIFREYIAPAPDKASAYYALFLRINREPLFSPMLNRFDSRCFAAVATSLNNRNPHAARAIHLSNIATKAMAATRPATPKDTIDINSNKVEKIGIYDIKLPDVNGDSISLSKQTGKVVLLDFTVYSIAGISSRNIYLREIYEKYRDRGLEIYQVSFDENESFWNNSADNLPWICVRDGQGQFSTNILLYNLQSLPTYYLINKRNELVYRDSQIKELEKTIEELLSE